MDKVIKEFRVIETDDGFRIEIKGDKERMKRFMSGFGGRWGGHHRRGSGWGMRWGPFGHGFGPMMWGQMAGCCSDWDLEVEEEEQESPEAADA
ncbi:MAG: hypothetical protein ACE5NC_06395 [Anaerolineae bacterium]